MFSSLEQIQITLHQAFMMGRTSYIVEFKLKAVNKLNNEFNCNISKASRVIGSTRKMLSVCKGKFKNKTENMKQSLLLIYKTVFPILGPWSFIWCQFYITKKGISHVQVLVSISRISNIGEVVEQKWKDLVDTFQRKEKSGTGGMTVVGLVEVL